MTCWMLHPPRPPVSSQKYWEHVESMLKIASTRTDDQTKPFNTQSVVIEGNNTSV